MNNSWRWDTVNWNSLSNEDLNSSETDQTGPIEDVQPQVDHSWFLFLCKCKELVLVKRYIEQHSPLNINMTGEMGNTPLHLAVVQNSEDVVAFLLEEAKADVMARNRAENTPLHLATEARKTEAMVLLLQAKADTEATNSQGETPLHIAAEKGCIEAVELLLQFGANVDARTNKDYTPLLSTKQPAITQLLLEHHANPQAKEENGITAMHFAARDNDLARVNLLLQFQGEIRAKNHEGFTPLHVAALRGSLQVLKVLLQRANNTEIKTNRGETLLHIAINDLGGDRETILFLIQAGADLYATDQEGITPLAQMAKVIYRYEGLELSPPFPAEFLQQMELCYHSPLATANRNNRQRGEAACQLLGLLRWLLLPLNSEDSEHHLATLPIELQHYLLSFVIKGSHLLTLPEYQTIQQHACNKTTLQMDKADYLQKVFTNKSEITFFKDSESINPNSLVSPDDTELNTSLIPKKQRTH